MNPVTQGLLRKLNDPSLRSFVENWDALNDLIINIYQQKSVTFEQQALFFELQNRLRTSYASFASELEPFWRNARVKGGLAIGDPFNTLIEKKSAKEFVENWDAMRTLPVAREALNEMLMKKADTKAGK